MLERVRKAAKEAKALLDEARVKTMDQIVSLLSQREVDTSPREDERNVMKEQGGPIEKKVPEKQEEPTPARTPTAKPTPAAVKETAKETAKEQPPREEAKPKRPPTPAPSSAVMMAQASPRPDPRLEIKKEEAPQKSEPDYGIFATLPPRYGSHRLALIARDPKWGFAYWDVDREQGGALFENGAQAVLRLIDANDGHVLQSPQVLAESGRYYFRLPVSDQRYQLTLTAVFGDGREVEVLRSNVVLAPPELPRPEREPRFVSMNPQIEVLEQAKQIDSPPRLVDVQSRRMASYPTPSIAGQTLTLLPQHEKPRSAPVEEGATATPGAVSFGEVSDFRAVLSGSEIFYLGTSSAELLRKKSDQ